MERIIIDCDPGHDDAVALAMAKGLEDRIKVEMIIASHGNQTVDKTLVNALNLAQALEMDTSVYKGSEGPLIRERIKAGYIHGENGLAGPVFPPCTRKCQGNGIRAAIDLVLDNPGQITFVSVGPFTDLAICLKSDPDFAKSLKQIVLMGGSMFKGGNVTSSAEFNVYADPEAADIVFKSGVPIYDFSLDVTLQLMLNDDIVSKVKSMKPTNYTKIFLASMENYVRSCLEYIHDYPAMHDPCTIAFLADPSIFKFEKRNVSVDTKSDINYGNTVASWIDENSTTNVGVWADSDKFWNLFFECIKRLP